MSLPLTDSQQAEVDAALRAGQKIEAIKRYRDYTQASLADSKRAVEAREVLLHGAGPETFAPIESNGCALGAGTLLLFATALIVVGFLALIFFRS